MSSQEKNTLILITACLFLLMRLRCVDSGLFYNFPFSQAEQRWQFKRRKCTFFRIPVAEIDPRCSFLTYTLHHVKILKL